MKTRSNLLSAALALVLSGLLASCTGSSSPSGGGGGSTPAGGGGSSPVAPPPGTTAAPGSSTPAGSSFRVGLELTGAKNDGGFDQAIYSGLLDAQKKYGVQIQVAENKTSLADQTNAVTTLAQNNDFVFVESFIGDAAKQIAKQNPKTQFSVEGGSLDPSIPNLHAHTTNTGLAAYVAGVVAAKMTKSNTVGYVGASEIPATTGSLTGFKLGIQSAAPNVKVLNTYTGSFVDSNAAKEATSAQISQGADVIYTYLDSATDGAFAAVKASGKDVKIFNITSSRCSDGDFVAGTDVISPTNFISNLIKNAIDGNYPSDVAVVDLSSPADQKVQMCPPFSSLQSLADATAKKVADGTIKLPKTVV